MKDKTESTRVFTIRAIPSPEFIGPWGMSGDLGLPIV
ncbi:hypothetical protein Tco_0690185, partial [Tanacetum coccineum]